MNRDITTRTGLSLFAEELTESLARDSFSIVLLKGTLGSGKTTCTQIVGKLLGIEEELQSPTYALLREYSLESHPAGMFLHLDLYRVKDLETLELYGILDLFSQKKGIFFIEWPELLQEWLQSFKNYTRTLEFEYNVTTEKRTVFIDEL